MDTEARHIDTTKNSLWRDKNFLALWLGQSVSTVGSRMTGEALPLAAVLTLHATPLQMGWLQFIAALPVLLIGMVIGAFVDRYARRPFLIGADYLRGFLLLIIPVAALIGHLALWMLFVIYPTLSLLNQIFNTAYQAYLPSFVGRHRLMDANTKLSITSSIAEIIGPGLAGSLVQLFSAPIAILLDALSYLFSAISIQGIRHVEMKRAVAFTQRGWRTSSARLRREIIDGVRYIAHDKKLSALAVTAGISALFSGIIFNMDVLFAIQSLHLSAALFGLTVTFGGIGALIGAALCQRLVQSLGVGPVLVSTAFLNAICSWFIPLAHGDAWHAALFLMAAQLFGDLFGVIFEVLESTVRQILTEDAMLGRVNGTINLLMSALTPIGAVLGGVIATALSLRFAMTVGAAGMTLGAFALLIAPLWRIQTSS
ncbi:MFS transporter [Alicyclobacillus suci]|uniref:MFS transporter n=1 Tax=Alicyclobacillus suci TaxID=2816080 RepID=UPI001A8FB9F4|nr:MFS transporter [Alicyclobacillus suci]